MATNYTENYQLNQWEPTDKVLRTDFNADNLKIDTALKEGATAREALAEVVAGHTADIAKLGNCKIYHATYMGNGKSSQTLTFPGMPVLVMIQGGYVTLWAIRGSAYGLWMVGNGSGGSCVLSWGSDRLILSSNTFVDTCNDSSTQYNVVALMSMT